jgi:ketosteroid isomerase-like protein
MTSRTAAFDSALLLTAVLLTLCGCTARDGQLPNDVTTALARAFTGGDALGCAALYTDDAAIMSGTARTARGKAEIIAFFQEQVARDILFSTDSDVSLVQGDLAMDQGSYRVRDTNRGLDVESGQYLNVWRLIAGHWRIYRTMYNVTTAPQGGVSVTPDEGNAPK